MENRLAGESSPYLLQHKQNPVAWHPWGSEALALAKRENKPILLSIGYAACHWCHVMAHESFENEAIARTMNALFVNIKVDREERPDLDTIYQSALALLGEHGGWPLTMFLTPEGEPFWGGTYFPPEPRYGRPGFPQVLEAIAAAFRERPGEIQKNVTAIKSALAKLATPQAAGSLALAVNLEVAERLVREIDPFEGGLGSAPKFPQPSVLKLLWRAWLRSGKAPFRHAVELTLSKMSQGGIYDHLAGGYARYATDEKWLVPHFEKMLYDNAQLLELLTWVAPDADTPLFEMRARETVDWMLREMLAEESPGGRKCGGFASTLDADSEGEEGKFYVWSAEEIDRILGEDATRFNRAYDVGSGGNWEGKTILNRSQRPQLGSAEEEAFLARCRAKLLAAREKRTRPGWDDKVLADWNGLAIAALAAAAPTFRMPEWLAAAERAYAFVCKNMTKDGRLMHSWRHGRARHQATLDDHAQLSAAALALYEATGEASYLDGARGWVELLDRHYWDALGGGYFLTPDDGEQLVVRPKNAMDSATPSGNGTMVEVLARLHYLTGEHRYRDRAEAIIACFSGELSRNFFPYATLLNGNELLQDALQIVVTGSRQDPSAAQLLEAVYSVSLPNRVLQVVEPGESLPPGHPAHGKAADSGPSVFLCRQQTCSLPIGDPEALRKAFWEMRGG